MAGGVGGAASPQQRGGGQQRRRRRSRRVGGVREGGRQRGGAQRGLGHQPHNPHSRTTGNPPTHSADTHAPLEWRSTQRRARAGSNGADGCARSWQRQSHGAMPADTEQQPGCAAVCCAVCRGCIRQVQCSTVVPHTSSMEVVTFASDSPRSRTIASPPHHSLHTAAAALSSCNLLLPACTVSHSAVGLASFLLFSLAFARCLSLPASSCRTRGRLHARSVRSALPSPLRSRHIRSAPHRFFVPLSSLPPLVPLLRLCRAPLFPSSSVLVVTSPSGW